MKIGLSTFLYLYLPINLSTYLSIYLSIYSIYRWTCFYICFTWTAGYSTAVVYNSVQPTLHKEFFVNVRWDVIKIFPRGPKLLNLWTWADPRSFTGGVYLVFSPQGGSNCARCVAWARNIIPKWTLPNFSFYDVKSWTPSPPLSVMVKVYSW